MVLRYSNGVKKQTRSHLSSHITHLASHFIPLPRDPPQIMASGSKDSAFNILGSSKLNTADGKNPTSSATTSTSTQPGTASGQKNSEEYRRESSKAHDALENRLRDEVSCISKLFSPHLSMIWNRKICSSSLVLLRPLRGSETTYRREC